MRRTPWRMHARKHRNATQHAGKRTHSSHKHLRAVRSRAIRHNAQGGTHSCGGSACACAFRQDSVFVVAWVYSAVFFMEFTK
eukprot:10803820-Lingulodinium_polyedra.AAC.1